MICDQIISFDDQRQELWVQFADKETFFTDENDLKAILTSYPGKIQLLYIVRRSALLIDLEAVLWFQMMKI